MARGRSPATAAAVTLLDFFQRRAAPAEPPGDPGRGGGGAARGLPSAVRAAGAPEASPRTACLAGLPADVAALSWALCGPASCCAVRQCSRAVKKACPADLGALRPVLGRWALSVVDMTALRPVGERDAASGVGPGTVSRLGRWGDFAVVTDGAGNGFVRGPALLRCTHRWRLRAREAQLAAAGGAELAAAPLLEQLRRSAAAAGAAAGPGPPSVHAFGSIWDGAACGRPRKRRRVAGGAAAVAGGAERGAGRGPVDDAGSLFSSRRWDALMHPRVPWRLRAAALVYHHHCAQGCPHEATRAAARGFVVRHTRGDERLRAALLDDVAAAPSGVGICSWDGSFPRVLHRRARLRHCGATHQRTSQVRALHETRHFTSALEKEFLAEKEAVLEKVAKRSTRQLQEEGIGVSGLSGEFDSTSGRITLWPDGWKLPYLSEIKWGRHVLLSTCKGGVDLDDPTKTITAEVESIYGSTMTLLTEYERVPASKDGKDQYRIDLGSAAVALPPSSSSSSPSPSSSSMPPLSFR
ncbi:unnamed protein product, partial [Prorocentrum cordatum]